MKKTLFATIFSVISFYSMTVFAIDGTINFSGEIIDSGCKVDGANNTQSVILPKLAKDSFGGVNAVAGRTPFTIKLVNCPPNTSGQIKFEGQTYGNSPDTLANTGSAGVGIGIQVVKPNSSDLVIFNRQDGGGSFADTDVNNGEVQLTYSAQYVAKELAQISAGTVAASATIEISY